MVRKRRALRGTGTRAIRLLAADPFAAHLARKPALARSRLAGRLRTLDRGARRRTGGSRQASRHPDADAVPGAWSAAEEPHPGVADGHVFLLRRRPGRLPPGAPGRARHGWRRPGHG
ncbi:hypothetical protein G6F65_019973 [Rhizopus arrhizus]|nr:hypothetical protein G6F65_019973 [Rhizopus arrhizus]